ncbi:MAG: acyl-CoA synthetase [Acidimicrobiales bacterium]
MTLEAALVDVVEAICDAVPEREAVVVGDRRLTFADIRDRSRRLATGLRAHGLGCRVERDQLAAHESGQSHVGLYLHNGPEFLEGLVGAAGARAVGVNVNYRYVSDELTALLTDARAEALIFHAALAPVVAEVRDRVPTLRLLLQVADASAEPLLTDAVDYESFLAAHQPEPNPDVRGDDLYIAYTGGTTGLPRGVMWRQADMYMAGLGGSDPADGREKADLAEVADAARSDRIFPYLISAPLMHAAGLWIAFLAWSAGNPVLLSPVTDRLDAEALLSTAERERAAFTTLVGNAFAQPLIDELDRRPYDLSALRFLSTGGAAMTEQMKAELLKRLPNVRIIDVVGASETGAQGRHVSGGTNIASGRFEPGPGTCVLSDDLSGVLEPGDDETGWLARSGRIPLGYLGDPEKTAATFPEVAGVRYVVPGDRARVDADGAIVLLGRDSACINTGGEKVWAEEVEDAVGSHPGVADVIVVGRPSPRWGSEVVAVVACNAELDLDEIRQHVRGSLAGYKVPKAFVVVAKVERGPNGKADRRWAADVAAADG